MSNGTATREASRPAAGALRVGVDVSLANLAMWLLGQVLPAGVPLADVENLVVVGIAAALAALGKHLRSADNVLGEIL